MDGSSADDRIYHKYFIKASVSPIFFSFRLAQKGANKHKFEGKSQQYHTDFQASFTRKISFTDHSVKKKKREEKTNFFLFHIHHKTTETTHVV